MFAMKIKSFRSFSLRRADGDSVPSTISISFNFNFMDSVVSFVIPFLSQKDRHAMRITSKYGNDALSWIPWNGAKGVHVHEHTVHAHICAACRQATKVQLLSKDKEIIPDSYDPAPLLQCFPRIRILDTGLADIPLSNIMKPLPHIHTLTTGCCREFELELFPNLERLVLNEWTGWSSYTSLTKTDTSILDDMPDGRSFAHLSRLTSLCASYVGWNEDTSEQLRALPLFLHCSALRELDLEYSDLSTAALLSVPEPGRLEALTLSSEADYEDHAIARFTALTRLTIPGLEYHPLTARMLRPLTRLLELELHGQPDDARFAWTLFDPLAQLTSLIALDIFENDRDAPHCITDKPFLRGLSSLRNLQLFQRGCRFDVLRSLPRPERLVSLKLSVDRDEIGGWLVAADDKQYRTQWLLAHRPPPQVGPPVHARALTDPEFERLAALLAPFTSLQGDWTINGQRMPDTPIGGDQKRQKPNA